MSKKTWYVALSLNVLLAQLNKAYPKRSKKSDGSIGDERHQKNESSDHNPFILDKTGRPVVRARDFTHDPQTGIDCNWLAKTLVANKDSRIDYIIWNRQICSSYPARGKAAWVWRPYSGTNGHTKHLHLSVSKKETLFNSERPWELDFPDNSDVDDVARAEHPEPAPTTERPVATAKPFVDAANGKEPAIDGIPTGDKPAETDSGAAAGASNADSALSPQLITKESPSLFTRVMTAIFGFFSLAFASLTSWCGHNEVVTAVAQQAATNAVNGTERSDVATLGLVALYVALGLGAAVALLWITSRFYQGSANRSNTLNAQKMDVAANKDLNTVEFTK